MPPYLIFGALSRIFANTRSFLALECGATKSKPQRLKGDNVKKALSLIMLAAVLYAGPALAADPVIGTWKLNVAKSKFSSGGTLTAGTRVYTEADGVYTLDQKLTPADGKEISNRAQYRDGKEVKQTAGGPGPDATRAKKINANSWEFVLKKDGKIVGHVHRVVSADGKTLTVHSTGMHLSGGTGNEKLVFDRQ
jgi:hypothetical protein